MKGTVAGEIDVGRREQHRELVFVEGVLVAALIAVMQQMPAVDLLDQRQLLQRALGSSQVKRK